MSMMTRRRVRSQYLRPLIILLSMLSISMAFLASGCIVICGTLWGGITDSATGDAVPGASVTYLDINSATGSTTTNRNGLYSFDQAYVPVPAAGNVTFQVNAAGYEPLTETRLAQYNDNPNSNINDPSSFWEVQYFSLTPKPGWYHNELWGFSIWFPETWAIADIGGDVPVIAITPPEGVDDEFLEAAFVAAEEMPAGTTLETYYQHSVQDPVNALQGFDLDSEGEAVMGGESAKWAVVSVDNDSSNMKLLIYTVLDDTRGYEVVFVVEPAKLPTYQSQFEEVAQSLRFD